jgi:ribosomal-protein-alanine N-acetyltransferase
MTVVPLAPAPVAALRVGARGELVSPRLRLTIGHAALVPAVRDYYLRNRGHFKRWDPPSNDASYTLEAQGARVQSGLDAFIAGTAYRYWLLSRDDDESGEPSRASPLTVIGSVNVSQVVRGAFHSACLGYALDEAHVGRGLMTEALHAVITEMFSERVNLHRLQAAYRPENERSAAVLRRLGFEIEGFAPDYLFIDGAWRHHRITSLINPEFRKPEGW